MNFHINKNTNVEDILAQISYFTKSNSLNKNVIAEVITISSEIIYNIIKYAPEGDFSIHADETFFYIYATDNGCGFSDDVEDAFLEGFSKGRSLGLGLPSIIRMSDDLTITTSTIGTKIECIKEK